jgi:hypothetical protein
MVIDGRTVETTGSVIRVSRLKELARIPAWEKVYSKQGQILEDDDVVTTEQAEYGVVTDWTRGQD